jgi:hypothetical protein
MVQAAEYENETISKLVERQQMVELSIMAAATMRVE